MLFESLGSSISGPEYRGVNMSGIDEFDLVINDRIVNDIEDCEDIVRDLENSKMGNSEEPRELPYDSIDLADDSEESANTEDFPVLRLW